MFTLVVGVPKSGKTVSVSTFPKPMKYFDLEDGFKSVMYAKDKQGNLIVPDWKEIEVSTFNKEEYYPLSFKTADSKDFKAGVAPESAKAAVPIIAQYEAEIKALYTNPKKYKTVVIDSLSAVISLWEDMIMVHNSVPSIRLNDYKTLEHLLFNQFIPGLKGLIKKGVAEHVIVIAHETLDKDELSGRIVEHPIGTSKNTGKTLSREFDQVWRQMCVNGEYLWRTKPHGFFEGIGSRTDLPDPIKPPKFSEVEKYLKVKE